MKERFTKWKAQHWVERIEGQHIGDGFISLGHPVAPPLRRFARWIHANGWKLTSALIASVAAIAALLQVLQSGAVCP